MITLLVMVVMMFGVVATTGIFQFRPDKADNSHVVAVDAKSFLGMERWALDLPLRYPEVPESWVPNSARRTMIGNQPASKVSWVTEKGQYLELVQSPQPEEVAVKDWDSHAREKQGTLEAGGVTFTKWGFDDGETRPLYVARIGDVTFGISGVATESDFQTLADAVVAAQPIES